MIPGSRALKAAAVIVALAVHTVLGWALVTDEQVRIAGETGTREARIGTSFADMAAGTLQAEAAHEIAEPTTPDVVRAAEAPTPVETPPDGAPAITAQSVTQVVPRETTPQDIVEADEASTAAVTPSVRPKQRSEVVKQQGEQAAAPKAQKKRAAKKQPRGNAAQDATAGSATGKAEAEATASGTAGGTAKAAGNAAASNYPGLVMQKIARVPRPRAGGRGTAVVAFRVATSGALAGVSIARSSGSAVLDREALRMIRRAAPFPAPPAGAQRRFRISIEGR